MNASRSWNPCLNGPNRIQTPEISINLSKWAAEYFWVNSVAKTCFVSSKSSVFSKLSFVHRALYILKRGWHLLTHYEYAVVLMLSMFRSRCLFCLHKDTSLISYLDNRHCASVVKSSIKLHITSCLQWNVKIHSACPTWECVSLVFSLNFLWYLFFHYRIEFS